MDTTVQGEFAAERSFPKLGAGLPATSLADAAENSIAKTTVNRVKLRPIPVTDSSDDDEESDEDSMTNGNDLEFSRSSSTSQRQSTTPSRAAQSQAGLQASPTSEGDMIEVKHGPYQIPLDPSNKATGKLKNKYMLPDGTVVNGKGLGRGRPGFKRGPRKSTLSNEPVEPTGSSSAAVSTPSSVSQPRSISGKRKRALSATDGDYLPDHGSKESTPEYNPASSSQTRSGRQTQKPVQAIAAPISTVSPATKRPSLGQSTSSPSIKKHPKIKAKVYRGREQFALCEHCLRGNGPPGNVIVFCDACNKCWHQRCHEPSISKDVVADTKAEWFCAECDRILHGKKKVKPVPKPAPSQFEQRPTIPPPISAPTTEQPVLRYGPPYVPGMSLTLNQRKQYLESLTKEKLIDIIFRAADLAPNMPIFETPYHLVRQLPIYASPQQSQTSAHRMPPPPSVQQFPSQSYTNPPQHVVQPVRQDAILTYTHPTAGVPSKPNTQALAPQNGEDEGYYDDFDEMALLYPKPGEGVYDLALPPEHQDLAIMLEGPDCITFSHWVRGHEEMKKPIEGAR